MIVGADRAGRRDVAQAAVDLLRRANVSAPEREALWLLESVTGLSLAERVREATELSDADAARLLELVRRRAAGEPLQYLTGVAGFRGLELRVGPGVFIPRPETEGLVEVAVDLAPPSAIVADVGTGSGAIAVAVALERPDATVFATETSAGALRWARANINGLRAPVTLVAGDLLDPLPRELFGRLDVVVSNPPYVGSAEEGTLPREVAAHEPYEALFAGPEGLTVIRRLVSHAHAWLAPGGHLVTEIGEGQERAVTDLFEASGFVRSVVHRDLAGRPRVVAGRRLGS